MKKVIAVLLSCLMLLGLLAGCADSADPTDSATEAAAAATSAATNAQTEVSTEAAATLETIEEGKLIMSTNAAFPPYEMVNDDGTFSGIDVEIAEAIAEKLGLELVVDDMGFDAALLAVQNGTSDIVMSGVSVTDKRKEVMEFSDSYATAVQVVIVKEGSEVTLDNLGDYQIGCQAATTGYLYASDTPENGGYGEDHVTAYETGALAVQALMNGQIDAVIIDNEPAKAYVEANEGLTILEGEWVTEEYAIGIGKGNTALVEAVNAALAELKEDGTLQSIIDKYISAD